MSEDNMGSQFLIFVAGGVGGAVGAIALLRYATRRRRAALRKSFSDREEISFSEWYERFYAQTEIEPWIAQDIIQVIAGELGIPPTKLRPSDRLDEELQDKTSLWIDGGYKVDHMLHDVACVLYERVQLDTYDPRQHPKTLDELIRSADLFVKTCRSIEIDENRSPKRPETRCRKCDYILRGITEPRCPECGERI